MKRITLHAVSAAWPSSPRMMNPQLATVLFMIPFAVAAPVLCAADAAPIVAPSDAAAAVTVTDNVRTWTLDNGVVKATINKTNGNMSSLVYRGIETMGAGGYWEQTPQGAPQLTDTVTIDPAKNGGDRAEVAVKGVTGGTVVLTPARPAAGPPATSKSAMRWPAARAASKPMPSSPIPPPTAPWVSAKAAISPS